MPVAVVLFIAPLVLLAVSVWQIRAVMRSPQPGLRGVEALAIIAPLYLLLFAVTYFLMAFDSPDTFTAEPLTRVDALYLTVTVFSTVGFGDISAASQPGRILVTIQMILNLIVLGAGVRLLTGAVETGAERFPKGPGRSRIIEEGVVPASRVSWSRFTPSPLGCGGRRIRSSRGGGAVDGQHGAVHVDVAGRVHRGTERGG